MWIVYVVGVVAICLVLARALRRKPAPVPYAPTLAEIEETDAKLRMIGGLPPRDAPRPKPAPAARKAAEADELP
jgi:hypothetical protein